MRHGWWALATATAFLLGLAAGRGVGPAPAAYKEPAAHKAPAAYEEPAAHDDPAAQTTSGISASLHQPAAHPPTRPPATAASGRSSAVLAAADLDDWPAALDELDALSSGADPAGAARFARALLDAIARRARDGDVRGARLWLDAFLARNPHHPQAFLLASDLWQMQGEGRRALDPLLELLAFADDSDVIEQTRSKLRLLVNVLETQLATRGDAPAIIRLFEALSARDPQDDGHRLRLARWLLEAGRVEEAGAVLAQTGTAGVDPESREDLLAAVALARQGLPLERQEGEAGGVSALHVRAQVGGRPVRLLVDTGATTTALSRGRAAQLDARPTGDVVRVRTAGGIVEAEIMRLSDVRVGALQLEGLDVIVLDQALPDGVDGLLGMDVLGHFPGTAGYTR